MHAVHLMAFFDIQTLEWYLRHAPLGIEGLFNFLKLGEIAPHKIGEIIMNDKERFESVAGKVRDRLQVNGFRERSREGESEDDGWWSEVAFWRKGRPIMSVWFDRSMDASRRFAFSFIGPSDVIANLLSEIPQELYDPVIITPNDKAESKLRADVVARIRKNKGLAYERDIDNWDHFGFYALDHEHYTEDQLVADAEAFVLDVVRFVEPEFFEKSDIDEIRKNKAATEREQLILARRGQGIFREGLFRLWGGCAVTGCKVYEVLRASHIKPWRLSNGAERLDPHNGLLLTATLDALFDRGLITFDDAGEMIISRRVSEDQRKYLMHEPSKLRHQPSSNLKDYLKSHRELIFRAV
jgi:HNH endonuclease